MSENNLSILAKLTVPQSAWKSVYRSIINFANEEIEVAHDCALQIYRSYNEYMRSKHETPFSLDKELQPFNLSKFQINLIKRSLYKKDNEKIYKPNKPTKLTNRVSYIDFEEFYVSFDKVTNTVEVTSVNFPYDLHAIIKEHLFMQQFLTMVESIDWPTRVGPVKAIRGCKIVYISNDEVTEFYSAGANPPCIPLNNSIASPEPQFLSTTQLKSVSNNSPLQKEEHYQEIQLIDPELF